MNSTITTGGKERGCNRVIRLAADWKGPKQVSGALAAESDSRTEIRGSETKPVNNIQMQGGTGS